MHVYMFELYNSYQLLDEDSTGWNIYMFRTHYDSFYANLTFPKEARQNKDVCIIKSNAR